MNLPRIFVAKDGYLRDPASRKFVFDRDGGKCGICSKPVTGSCHFHHKTPRSKGGSGIDNFTPTHPSCNQVKGNK